MIETSKVSFAPGTKFPTIHLPNLENGRPGSVTDYRGKKLLLQVWASW